MAIYLGVSWDDLVYVMLPLCSIALGFVIKQTSSPAFKQHVTFITGVLIMALVCGFDGLHSVVTTAGTVVIIRCLHPR